MRKCIGVRDNVQVPINDFELEQGHHFVLDGILSIPDHEKIHTKGIVVFAHGGGSERHSPRNQYVASVLNKNLESLIYL